ncbi:870_t:CDS:2 [Paraglomus occultum]|uniref:870_t:CDS:1 n=1 Tax=Paraglomus occultum TaxID=144539 RepID=A0A9N8ZRU6_9GLOM|nr:870_t:CDS:2 [Paraglomus occultum]
MPSEPATPQFQVYTATQACLSITLYFQLVEFRDSAFVWAGVEGKEVLSNLATAIPALHGGAPAATTMISNDKKAAG